MASAETKTPAPDILRALVAVGAELAKVGIAKDRQNTVQNFRFRGIDDTMNAVSPILAKNNVVFLVNYTDFPDVDRVTGKGTTLIYARVRGDFTFVSAIDGSKVTVTTYGVAMDSGDKATNKAMSAALKYALLQTFLIPTESSEDADASTPPESIEKPPEGFDDWFADILAVADEGFDRLRDAWRTSPDPFRAYCMKYRTAEWDAAKKKATGITNAAKKAAKA